MARGIITKIVALIACEDIPIVAVGARSSIELAITSTHIASSVCTSLR
jgi:hypothetical protein